jgi:hypothetical protein
LLPYRPKRWALHKLIVALARRRLGIPGPLRLEGYLHNPEGIRPARGDEFCSFRAVDPWLTDANSLVDSVTFGFNTTFCV